MKFRTASTICSLAHLDRFAPVYFPSVLLPFSSFSFWENPNFNVEKLRKDLTLFTLMRPVVTKNKT